MPAHHIKHWWEDKYSGCCLFILKICQTKNELIFFAIWNACSKNHSAIPCVSRYECLVFKFLVTIKKTLLPETSVFCVAVNICATQTYSGCFALHVAERENQQWKTLLLILCILSCGDGFIQPMLLFPRIKYSVSKNSNLKLVEAYIKSISCFLLYFASVSLTGTWRYCLYLQMYYLSLNLYWNWISVLLENPHLALSFKMQPPYDDTVLAN